MKNLINKIKRAVGRKLAPLALAGCLGAGGVAYANDSAYKQAFISGIKKGIPAAVKYEVDKTGLPIVASQCYKRIIEKGKSFYNSCISYTRDSPSYLVISTTELDLRDNGVDKTLDEVVDVASFDPKKPKQKPTLEQQKLYDEFIKKINQEDGD